ncbi:OmpA family protein [Winogradskyella forsetii]|uniref:OmpA family protein n=1 Tax=Winogradskyella forsetii TaxID=2686077 RepID=UPI0015C0356D|nr:OmpA family protein [Winogradskyella forsetii]
MLKKTGIILALLLVAQSSFSQQKSRADRFFEKGDYINAAKYYEEELAKSTHKKDLENIATCYYNTFQYIAASQYLRQLINGKFVESDKTYGNEFNFKFYQVLSALGDYETALDYFKLYKQNLSASFDKTEALETIEDFKLMNPDYKVKLVLFNSSASDFGAVKQGDSIYFTSDRHTKAVLSKKYKWTHRSFLDIYAVQDTEGMPSEIKPLPKVINSKLHEGNFCFSKDGNVLYISKSNLKDGKKEFNEDLTNTISLFSTTFSNGKWSELEKLPFDQKGFSYQHPALSTDGKKLYFSSDREGGFGDFDLYYVSMNSDGTFNEPINLGDTINTVNREHFPFISDEGNLFFASNGHLGLGMLDNFVSELVDGTFAQPINLGAPINTQYDDFNLNYYNASEGFFASNRNRTDDNIYRFVQTGEIFIREYINQFEVRDEETKAYIPNAIVILSDKRGAEIYSNTLDSIASFNKNLVSGNYQLKASNDAYLPGVLNVSAAEEHDQKHVLYLKKVPPLNPVEAMVEEKGTDKTLKVDDPKRFEMLMDTEGPPIVAKEGKLFFELEPIYFDFDMWNIRADSKVILDELAAKLERYPNIRLKISSHTDSRGSVRYNQVLSERRAESTRNYLALEGYVNARRLKFLGFGELVPKVDCLMSECTEEEHQLNRRSEFEIIEY